MRGGFIFRSQGPSLKVNIAQARGQQPSDDELLNSSELRHFVFFEGMLVQRMKKKRTPRNRP
jgi:hypothetical protein